MTEPVKHYRGVFVTETRDRREELIIVGGIGPRDVSRTGDFCAIPVGMGHPVLVDNAFAFGKVDQTTKNDKPALRVEFYARADVDLQGKFPALEGFVMSRSAEDITIIERSVLTAVALVDLPDDPDSDLEVEDDGVWQMLSQQTPELSEAYQAELAARAAVAAKASA